MKWLGVLLGSIALLAVVWLVVNRPQRPEPEAPPESVEILFLASETLASLTPEQLTAARQQGDELFRRYQCEGCHADSDQALKRYRALGNKYDIESLASYLSRPNPPMPIFPLTEQERSDLAVYLIDRYPGAELK